MSNLNIDLNLDNFFHNTVGGIASLKNGQEFKSLNKGKQIRANIVLKISDIFKLDKNIAFTLARVIEMVHNATLSHDDIIDQAVMRRGEKSLAAVHGNSRTVLLGDYMLSKALVELSEVKSVEVIQNLAICLRRLVDGEWIQLESTNPFSLSVEKYLELASLKTGSLFNWAFSAPAIVSRMNDQFISDLKNIGDLLGIIFQIKDDLIDFNDQSGKEKFIDVKNNNPNIVLSFMGLENNKKHEFNSSLLDTSIDRATELMRSKIKELNELVERFCEDNEEFQDFFKTVTQKVSDRAY